MDEYRPHGRRRKSRRVIKHDRATGDYRAMRVGPNKLKILGRFTSLAEAKAALLIDERGHKVIKLAYAMLQHRNNT